MKPAGRQGRGWLEGATLPGMAELAVDCQLCRLCSTRRTVVFGEGNPHARVMFVGEAPGYHEDRSGGTLTGPAGDLFDELLTSIGFARDDVYVTSVVKCRPPGNRSPFPDEVEQCEGFLFRQVTLVRPDVVCALGNVAIRLLTGKPHRLSRVHGQQFDVNVQGRPLAVVPLYHPGAVLHDAALAAQLRDDMRRLPQLLHAVRNREPLAVPPTIVEAVAAAVTNVADEPQLSLNLG